MDSLFLLIVFLYSISLWPAFLPVLSQPMRSLFIGLMYVSSHDKPGEFKDRRSGPQLLGTQGVTIRGGGPEEAIYN